MTTDTIPIYPQSDLKFTQKFADSDSTQHSSDPESPKQKPIQDVHSTQSDQKYSIQKNSPRSPLAAKLDSPQIERTQYIQNAPQSDPLPTQQQQMPQYKPLEDVVELQDRIISNEPGNEEGEVIDIAPIKLDELEEPPRGFFRDRIPLTVKQLLYIVVMQGLGSFAINFGINALIAWLMYRDIGRIPLAGSLTCIVSDLAVTSFAITALTCLIGTVLVKNDLRQGKIVRPIDRRWLLCPIYKKKVPTGCDWKSVLFRSIELGLIATVLYTLPTELIMIGAARNGMQIEWNFVIFKGVWGGIEGMIVGPYCAMIALATL